MHLSQIIPVAARQARAQHVDAHSLTIHGFAIQNALEDEGIGTGADITSAGAAPPAVRSRSRQRGSGTWS